MFGEYVKRFIKSPWQYMKNPKRTFHIICDVIKGSKLYQTYLYAEHRRIYGLRNRDKTFYIICPSTATQGLMSIHNYVLWKIRFAIERGYIPVVDYKNYANMYLESNLLGKVNAWEYYFKQPMGYRVEDIKGSRNVIICDKLLPVGYRGIDDEEEVLLFHNIINKYCVLNDKMKKKVLEAKTALFPDESWEGVMGVVARGTDYTSLQPHKHAIVPDIDTLIETIEEKLVLWEEKYIFLATEDQEIYDALKERFGDILFTYEAPRFPHNTGTKKLAEMRNERVNDRYLRGEEYLITIYLLAQCDSIITPVVGGGLAAVRINGVKYKHKYIFNLGEYE